MPKKSSKNRLVYTYIYCRIINERIVLFQRLRYPQSGYPSARNICLKHHCKCTCPPAYKAGMGAYISTYPSPLCVHVRGPTQRVPRWPLAQACAHQSWIGRGKYILFPHCVPPPPRIPNVSVACAHQFPSLPLLFTLPQKSASMPPTSGVGSSVFSQPLRSYSTDNCAHCDPFPPKFAVFLPCGKIGVDACQECGFGLWVHPKLLLSLFLG